MKFKIGFVLSCLVILLVPVASTSLPQSVASVNGVAYQTFQEAFDAAKGHDSQTITLLRDIDLGDDSLKLTSGSIILYIDGYSLSGIAANTHVLNGTASRTIQDSSEGCGHLENQSDIDASAAILIENDTCSLTISGRSLQTTEDTGIAVSSRGVKCITIHGGNVRDVRSSDNQVKVVDSDSTPLVCHVLTIGNPPVLNTPYPITATD